IVHVKPDRADCPAAVIMESRLRGDVSERSVAPIAIERNAVETADQQVGMAVVIIVANSRADIVIGATETGALSDVFEVHAAGVTEQPVGGLLARGQRASVGEEQVELAVAVVIENGDPSRRGGGKGLLL